MVGNNSTIREQMARILPGDSLRLKALILWAITAPQFAVFPDRMLLHLGSREYQALADGVD
jgi:hypothetical protein